MGRLALLSVATCALLIACGPPAAGPGDGGVEGDGSGSGSSDQPHELAYIEVTPVDSLVELDLNTPGSLTLTVTGKFLDGVDEDLSSTATLSVDNAAVGALNANVLEIAGFATTGVQTALVTAESGGFDAKAQVTVVAYRRTGTTQDFFFVLPHNDAAGEQTKPLEFGTAVPSMDVMMLMDTTASMGGEISTLRGALRNTVVPGIRGIVPDTQFGVAGFEDFPIPTYGYNGPDQPYTLLQSITDNVTLVQAGLDSLSLGNGYDWPESGIEAIYQTITGAGITSPAPTNVPASSPSFRASAMPVVVAISDAMMHEPNGTKTCVPTGFSQVISNAYTGAVATAAHTRAQTKTALANKCARVVGVATNEGYGVACSAQPDLEDFATSTGARVAPSAWDVSGARPAGCAATQCCTGQNGVGRATDSSGLCPLVFLAPADGSGLGAQMVTGIQMLARFALFDVNSEKSGVGTDVAGNALPTGITTADFIKSITPNGFTLPAAPPVVPNPTPTATGFNGVTPATKVAFDVKAFNDIVPQTPAAQIFRANISVIAGGCTPLDAREVVILVPPAPLSIGKQTAQR